MSAAAAWLRQRGEGVPSALLQAMIEALPERADDAVPEALVAGALRLYAEVGRGSGGREFALPLLAADALFTHAFEAQAEMSPAGLEALVATCQRELGEIVL